MIKTSLRGAVACSFWCGALAASGCAGPATFATPQAALQAVADVAGQHDRTKLEEIFGSGATTVIWSGDEVADREDALRVREMILQRVELKPEEDGQTIALVGNEQWPFPIPLVMENDRWSFDLDAGKEELESRRVGRNELLTLETLRAFVDAQREYASSGHDGTARAYAQKIWSDEGRHNGLYWPTAEGEPESPLGELVAAAAGSGYGKSREAPAPYHGYFYKILTLQGRNAPGGERSYLDASGHLTRGFAAVAWPATYEVSGIMTFIVDHAGVIFQKDLGPHTSKEASAITRYDPDTTWDPASE